jgi:PAS domain S-box-containing protein
MQAEKLSHNMSLSQQNLNYKIQIFEQVSDACNDFYMAIKPNASITFISNNGVKILGYEASHILKTKITDFVHITDLHKINSILLRQFDNDTHKEDTVVEFVSKLGDFKKIYIKFFHSEVNSKSQEIFLKCQDVTKQLELEDELKKYQSSIDMIMGNSVFGIFSSELEKPIDWRSAKDKNDLLKYIIYNMPVTKVNKTFAGQYGVSENEVLGKMPIEFFDGDPKQIQELLYNTFEFGRYKMQSEEKLENGESRWFEGDYQAMYNKQGLLKGIFGVQKDITERKRLLDILFAQNEMLKKIAWMQSHEIRKPVAQILGALELAKVTFDIEQQNQSDFEFIKILETAVGELDGIILEMARRAEKIEFLKSDDFKQDAE